MIAKIFVRSERITLQRYFVLLVLLISSTTVLIAQTAKPTPTPDTDVVKISTTLIQLDVTVIDRKGKTVNDLKPEEVEIFENGEKQKITNFSFISNVQDAAVEPSEKKRGNTDILPLGAIRPEQVKRTIALVVDDLTLSFESTYSVRTALRKFVDTQMQDGDLVAIIRTGAGVGALQQFTNDKRQLYAAIEKLRWNPGGVGRIGAFAPIEQPGIPAPETGDGPGRIRTKDDVEREVEGFREDLFATGTLGAINYVVRGMRELPGRKSILLLSDGFSLFTQDADGFKETSRIMTNLRSLIDMANRAAVVIYTMDARGVVYTGFTAADDLTGRSIQQFEDEVSNRRNKVFDTQEGLRYLAFNTGGLAIVNSNDLAGGIRRILDDQSYYLIAYIPDEETFDPATRRFNKLEVKVNRPGTRVRYRSGFFGVSDENVKAPEQTRDKRILTALASPFAINDISLHLNALFGASAQGSFIRSFLHIRTQDLTFTDGEDGTKKAVLDVVTVGYGDKGIPVESTGKTYTITLKKDAFEHAMKMGLIYDFVIPIKKSGAYQLRVAVSDPLTGKVGSANQFVEVPNLKKERIVLSGLLLENISAELWEKRRSGSALTPEESDIDARGDSALRRFKKGTVLNYGFTIYNAKLDAAKKPDLSLQIRIFRDGERFYEGKPQPVPKDWQQDLQKVSATGSFAIGSLMPAGDYVLQIMVIDNLAKEKRKLASQFVQFEVYE